MLDNKHPGKCEPILSIEMPSENPGNDTDKAKSMIEVMTTTKSKVLNADRKNSKNPRP